MKGGVNLADTSQELSFFATGDALAQESSTFEPVCPERARRRRALLALAVTTVILLVAVIVCVVALPSPQA